MNVSEQSDRLSNIRLAAPCNKDWNNMEGDERVRFCNACEKSVYNISDMSRKDAEEFLRENGVSKCMRIFRRTDGTIVNDNCPVGLRKIRDGFRWAAACVTWAISCSFAVTAAFAQSTQEALIKQLAPENVTDTPSKVILNLPSQPHLPVVVGSVDVGGMDFGKGAEMEEVLKDSRKSEMKGSKAFRKKLLTAKFPKSFEKAVKYQQLRDFDHAILFYRKVLAEHPKFDSAYNNLALCLIERNTDGDLREASDLLSRSKQLSSEMSGQLFQMKVIPSAPGIEMVEIPKHEIVKNGSTLLALGLLNEKRGDLESAVKNYIDSLDREPTNLIAIKNLTELYVGMNKPDSARRVLVNALRTSSRAPVFDETSKILSAALTNLDRATGFTYTPSPEKRESYTTPELMQGIYNPLKKQKRKENQ